MFLKNSYHCVASQRIVLALNQSFRTKITGMIPKLSKNKNENKKKQKNTTIGKLPYKQ